VVKTVFFLFLYRLALRCNLVARLWEAGRHLR